MDTISAFARGQASVGNPVMVFDWHGAAKLIKKSNPHRAAAGLQSDWEYTGGPIFENGKIVSEDDTYVYLASTWATPELEMDGVIQDCYLMMDDSPGWNEHTYWPESAISILSGDN